MKIVKTLMTKLAWPITAALLLTGCSKSAASIGIIGGADGPTAVFVAEKTKCWEIIATVAAVLLVVAVVIYIKQKKK